MVLKWRNKDNYGFRNFMYFQLHLHYVFLNILTQFLQQCNFYLVGAKSQDIMKLQDNVQVGEKGEVVFSL